MYPQSGVREDQSSNQSYLPQTTRLAPSPTGALHLGNAFAFVINWALARKLNWNIALRIEDLDHSRVKPGMIEQTIRTLEWLGLDWDTGPTTQFKDLGRYAGAMHTLAQDRHVYPCVLTRSQIRESASAPHADDAHAEPRFDPSLRPIAIPVAFQDSASNWRFIVNPSLVSIEDTHMGLRYFDLFSTSGDFVVWTKQHAPSYQLAVVVDDARAGVTQIVRGRDLLESAARQVLLYRALGIHNEPTYTHLPLIIGEDGVRLAKRHGVTKIDTQIDSYAQSGTSQERVIGLIAYWCRITQQRSPMSLIEFKDAFALDTLPKDDIVFTQEDDAWLRS